MKVTAGAGSGVCRQLSFHPLAGDLLASLLASTGRTSTGAAGPQTRAPARDYTGAMRLPEARPSAMTSEALDKVGATKRLGGSTERRNDMTDGPAGWRTASVASDRGERGT